MNVDDLETILSDYPLYLRWGQLLDLCKRLGVGGKRIVQQAIAEERIQKVMLEGKRHHYTRASVAAMITPSAN